MNVLLQTLEREGYVTRPTEAPAPIQIGVRRVEGCCDDHLPVMNCQLTGARHRGSRTEAMLKAVCFTQFGGPEVLEMDELPDPHPGPAQVRVAVRAVGINPTDWEQRSGMIGGELPQTTGSASGNSNAEVEVGLVQPGSES
jgi:hypothetical protein